MSTVGLRELRQDASDLVRRVEAGEEITITVAGRPGARLVAARAVRWRAWDEVADLFQGPGDPGGRMTVIWSILMCVTLVGTVTESVASAQQAILDTSVVIAEEVAPIPGVLAISAITLAELHFGVLVAKTTSVRAERLRRLSLLQQRFDALPVDEAVSASYGRLAAVVVEAGRQPRRRVMDLLIAATAHAHGARLYTRNVRDFAGLEGLVDVVEV